MAAEIITFHKMLGGCIQRELKYWEFFISSYGSLAQHLIKRHFGVLESRLPQVTQAIFDSISENDRSFLKEFSGSSERDFLMYFEGNVFAVARDHCGREAPPNEFDFELNKLFDKVPLAHQEVVWLAMQGYKQDETNKILRIPLALVQTGEVEVLKRWSKLLEREISSVPFLQDIVRQQIESQKGPNCPSIKVFSDLMDGRIVWRDKQQVENHVSECLYCLDRETTLKKTLFYLRALNPLPPESVQDVLKKLKIELKPATAKSSLLARVIRALK